jgi:hypothetical protein
LIQNQPEKDGVNVSPSLAPDFCQTPIAHLEIGPLTSETMDKLRPNYRVAQG